MKESIKEKPEVIEQSKDDSKEVKITTTEKVTLKTIELPVSDEN